MTTVLFIVPVAKLVFSTRGTWELIEVISFFIFGDR